MELVLKKLNLEELKVEEAKEIEGGIIPLLLVAAGAGFTVGFSAGIALGIAKWFK